MHWAEVGKKCEWILDEPCTCGECPEPPPLHTVLTVSDVAVYGGTVFIMVKEHISIKDGYPCWIKAEFFRPIDEVQERKDVAIFAPLLNSKTKETEPA